MNGEARVKKAIASLSEQDLFVSVVSIGELAKGIALLDEGRKKNDLGEWLLGLERDYGTRILAIDMEIARTWGEITASARRKGAVIGACDGLIAATAVRHGLVVMTRNTRDFEGTGARLLNPWASS